MKKKLILLIAFFTLILYLLPALSFDYAAINSANYPQMYLYKKADWYPSSVYQDRGIEYIEGQYIYYGWCYKIEMTVYKSTQTQKVYNFFTGRGTAVTYHAFGKTITRNFFNGVPISFSLNKHE